MPPATSMRYRVFQRAAGEARLRDGSATDFRTLRSGQCLTAGDWQQSTDSRAPAAEQPAQLQFPASQPHEFAQLTSSSLLPLHEAKHAFGPQASVASVPQESVAQAILQ